MAAVVGGAILLTAALANGRHAAREACTWLLVGAAGNIAEPIAVGDGAPVVDMPFSAFELLSPAQKDRTDYRVGRMLTGNSSAPGRRPGAT